MKRVALCILVLLLSALGTVAVVRYENNKGRDDSADVFHIAEVRRLVTDKTEYEVGEPIMVTAWSPDLSDKVMLVSVSDATPLRWKRVGASAGDGVAASGNGSGVPMDITAGKIPGSAANSVYKNLPAGKYVVTMQDNNNTNVIQVFITIK